MLKVLDGLRVSFTVKATIRGGRALLETFDGAGDLVHAVVKTATFGQREACVGCKAVENWLNEKLPNPLKRKEAHDADPESS